MDYQTVPVVMVNTQMGFGCYLVCCGRVKNGTASFLPLRLALIRQSHPPIKKIDTRSKILSYIFLDKSLSPWEVRRQRSVGAWSA